MAKGWLDATAVAYIDEALVAAVASGRISLDARGTVIGEAGAVVPAPVFRLQTEDSDL